MKDYYKILGVKPDAFAEEIHARWIQLMRKLHPDMGKVEATELERAREINEAYGVLKDSFSREQYDLRRAYQRKKRAIYLQRMLVPPAILIIFLISVIIIMQRPRAVTRLESSTVPPSSFTETTVNPPPSLHPKEKRAIRHTNDINRQDRITSPQTIFAPVEKDKSSDEVENPPPPPKLPKPENVTMRTGHASTIKKETNERNGPNQINRTDQTNEIDGINHTNQTGQSKPTRISEERKSSPLFAKAPTSLRATNPAQSQLWASPAKSRNPNPTRTNQIDERDQTDQTNPTIAQVNQPSLIATEEEIREFFAQYKQRYNLMDIHGFLYLFSTRAVQNGQYGFNEIKSIYSNFFNKSLKLQYDIEDMKVQIYQNAAEVSARYNLVQTINKAGKTKTWRGDIRWILIREDDALKIRFLDFRAEKSD